MTLPYDILGDALEAIGFQDFELRRFTGNSTDVAGRLVPSYSDEKTQCVGSIQPADYGTMEQLGFNVAKKAFNIWTETEIHTVRTHGGADLLIIGGEVYQAEDISDWHGMNGWQRITALLAPPPFQKYA